MAAEFDTLAEWTAQVAADLGPTFRIPAGCRGSGSPAALDWLLDRMALTPGSSLLDCGAGVGGPAAYAALHRALEPVLIEPEAGACRAARSLFGHPVVQASADALPVADESFDAAWALGVLCTSSNHLALLTELRRVVHPSGRIGLLVFMARSSEPFAQPVGNDFPTEERFLALLGEAGLRVEEWRGAKEVAPPPPRWQHQVDTVTQVLAQRHRHQRAWQLADQQADHMAHLLTDSLVTGELLSLRRCKPANGS